MQHSMFKHTSTDMETGFESIKQYVKETTDLHRTATILKPLPGDE